MSLNPYPHPDDLWGPRTQRRQLVECIKAKAKIDIRDGVKWITYPDEIRKSRKTINVIVEMPENALTKSCHEGRHHQCNHRRGARHETGVWFRVTGRLGFTWRCGCLCHHHPERIGMLF
ncbi:hypothetical protein [Mycolicibacterium houstonense]|uniref:hypothetical protein n=1 Tax=Mycolicibacterium houstonense TaxID=146021 RepID=UPI003F98ACF6